MQVNELKKAGLKVTTPRVRILNILESQSKHHMSPEQIYRKLNDQGEVVGLATVYRVLTQFENAGLVIRHHFESGQSMFELDTGNHHDHMVCTHCGHIEEFIDPLIEQQQTAITKKYNFQMSDHLLYIYGICSTCHGK